MHEENPAKSHPQDKNLQTLFVGPSLMQANWIQWDWRIFRWIKSGQDTDAT